MIPHPYHVSFFWFSFFKDTFPFLFPDIGTADCWLTSDSALTLDEDGIFLLQEYGALPIDIDVPPPVDVDALSPMDIDAPSPADVDGTLLRT